LKMLPGGALGQKHAAFKFTKEDFRFTTGKNGSIYAFCMTAPKAGTELKIKSLGGGQPYLDKAIKIVSLVGYKGKLKWRQESDGLIIEYPSKTPYLTAVVFKVD
jgi:alpha-L-fucosidase